MTSRASNAIPCWGKVLIGLGFALSLILLAVSWPRPCEKHEPTVLCKSSYSSALLVDWWNALQDPSQTLRPAEDERQDLAEPTQRAILAADLHRAEAALRWVACFIILFTSLIASLLSVVVILLGGARRGYFDMKISTKLSIACAWFPAAWWLMAESFDGGPGGKALFPVLMSFVNVTIEPQAFPLLRLSDGLFAAMLAANGAFIFLIRPRREYAKTDQLPILQYLQRAVTLFGGLFSLALVAVVIHARVVLLWPVATTGGCKETSTGSLAAYCSMVDGMVFVYGTVATLMVGIAIVISAAIVQGRISDAAYHHKQDDPDSWNKGELDTTAWGIAARLISIAAPLLSAPLSEALGRFGQ